MEIASSYRDNYFQLSLTGQMWQHEDLEILEHHIDICFKAKRPWIILDMERLTFLNSQALGRLVRLHARCKKAQGKLILYQLRSNVRDVIEISNLPHFMAIADTEEELVAQMDFPGDD
jgi:anti-anti-sigma factor